MKPSRALIVAFLLTVAVIAISAQNGPPVVPGIDTSGMDLSVRPQDDFFRYVNGKWVDTTPIPSDLASTTAPSPPCVIAHRKRFAASSKVKRSKPAARGSIGQKVGDYYKSFIDEGRVESLGVQPLAGELKTIDASAAAQVCRPRSAAPRALARVCPSQSAWDRTRASRMSTPC